MERTKLMWEKDFQLAKDRVVEARALACELPLGQGEVHERALTSIALSLSVIAEVMLDKAGL